MLEHACHALNSILGAAVYGVTILGPATLELSHKLFIQTDRGHARAFVRMQHSERETNLVAHERRLYTLEVSRELMVPSDVNP